MKILDVMIAALFLAIPGASSCAILTPPVVKHEGEISQKRNNDEVKNSAEKKTEEQQRQRRIWDPVLDRGP